MVAVVAMFFVLFALLQSRLVGLSLNTQSAQAAAVQSSCLLPLYDGRAQIYDCEMRPLTGVATRTLALALPGDESYARLYPLLSEENAAQLYAATDGAPSLVALREGAQQPEGIYCFDAPKRYYEAPIAVHTLGYLNQDGVGMSGIERCYNEILAAGGTRTFVCCTTTAAGGLMTGSEPELVEQPGTRQAVQLTLDRDIQRICEGIAMEELEQGAVVVMETATGKLRAVVSLPVYDPNRVEDAIAADDSSLLNRAISTYNVGSVFKPLVAAAALTAGFDEGAVYTCEGAIEVDGHIYHCNNNKAHGEMTLQTALAQSCNCYFIWLGQQLGGEAIGRTASQFGLGRVTLLADGYFGASGNLPNAQELENSGQLASISFGQGKLLATPIQITAAINAIANDGVYIGPTLAEGVVEVSSGQLIKAAPAQEQVRVLDEAVCASLQRMMDLVVEEGTAQRAKPEGMTAAGKTGTAQTGRYDEAGVELLDSWFAGYYPAQAPEYTIVVFADSTHQTGESLAPVFARLCEGIALAEN